MRLRRRKKDRRYGCTTIGSGGYTLIETVVSLAIFVIAATGDRELNHRIAQLCRQRRL